MPEEPWPGEDEPDPRWEVPPDPYEEEGQDNGPRRVAVVVLVFAAIIVMLLVWTIWSSPAVF